MSSVRQTKSKMAGIPAAFHAVCHVCVIWLNGLLRHTVLTHIHHTTSSCHLKPHQTACKPQLINSYTYHRATAHVLLTDCSCHPLPDDRSPPGTGWPSTGRTACVSTVSSPCLRDQRTSWAPAVSSYCLINTCTLWVYCTGRNLLSHDADTELGSLQ